MGGLLKLYDILHIINYWVIIPIVSIAFTVQIVYILLFFLPYKKYPKADKKHRFGIIIPARNEAAVIGETVKLILAQDYPRELFDVFVVADNCTDNTAEVARAAGAIVFERTESDPKKKRAGYALKHGFNEILKDYDTYDAFIKFDADNHMNAEFISKMNDAYAAGVKSARCYSNSKNLDANLMSAISGIWYIRDCRYACQARSFLRTGQMVSGAGLMFAAEIIRKHNGWDCLSLSDDSEWAVKRLLEGIKSEYVAEAVVYEDQPTTLRDAFARNKRMGKGLFQVFFRQTVKLPFKFFTDLNFKCKFAYLDIFLYMLFVPIALVCCIWFPLYYLYDIIFSAVMGGAAHGFLPMMFDGITAMTFTEHLYGVLTQLGIILGAAFILPFILQATLAVFLERKKLKVKSVTKLIPAILAFPLFMIIYAASITLGILTKPKWRQLSRTGAAAVPAQAIKGEEFDETEPEYGAAAATVAEETYAEADPNNTPADTAAADAGRNGEFRDNE